MAYKITDQNKAVRAYFQSQIRELETATTSVMKVAAQALARDTKKEIRKEFTIKANSTFGKAVKVYNLKPELNLGPASYVRLGVPFMKVFQEGATIQGQPNLIILLSTGERLGFRRVGKSNPWTRVWEGIKEIARLIKTGDGLVVAVPHQGVLIPIYKFENSVKMPKKVSFLEMAETIGNTVPEKINRLMEGKYVND